MSKSDITAGQIISAGFFVIAVILNKLGLNGFANWCMQQALFPPELKAFLSLFSIYNDIMRFHAWVLNITSWIPSPLNSYSHYFIYCVVGLIAVAIVCIAYKIYEEIQYRIHGL